MANQVQSLGRRALLVQADELTARRDRVRALPTIEEFALASVAAAEDASRPSGHVAFVGPTDE